MCLYRRLSNIINFQLACSSHFLMNRFTTSIAIAYITSTRNQPFWRNQTVFLCSMFCTCRMRLIVDQKQRSSRNGASARVNEYCRIVLEYKFWAKEHVSAASILLDSRWPSYGAWAAATCQRHHSPPTLPISLHRRTVRQTCPQFQQLLEWELFQRESVKEIEVGMQ